MIIIIIIIADTTRLYCILNDEITFLTTNKVKFVKKKDYQFDLCC